MQTTGSPNHGFRNTRLFLLFLLLLLCKSRNMSRTRSHTAKSIPNLVTCDGHVVSFLIMLKSELSVSAPLGCMTCAASRMRFSTPSPVLDKNPARMGPENFILSNAWVRGRLLGYFQTPILCTGYFSIWAQSLFEARNERN